MSFSLRLKTHLDVLWPLTADYNDDYHCGYIENMLNKINKYTEMKSIKNLKYLPQGFKNVSSLNRQGPFRF